jgi:hypothetical protein
MRSRKVALAAGVLAVVLTFVADCWLSWTPSSGTVRARFDKIQLGMTQVEAEETLGVPEGDYATARFPGIPADIYPLGIKSEGPYGPSRFDVQVWGFNDGCVQLGYDEHDRVRWKIYTRHFRSTGWKWLDRQIVPLLRQANAG